MMKIQLPTSSIRPEAKVTTASKCAVGLLLAVMFAVSGSSRVVAQVQSQGGRQVSDTQREFVPQHLLGLIHAAEVQAELKLSADRIQNLETFFAAIDGDWFRARNLPADKQYEVIAALESQLVRWFQRSATREQLDRLRQLEYRAQGIRMLLRDDLAAQLSLEPKQVSELARLAKATNAVAAEVQAATVKGSLPDALKKKALAANEAERDALKTVMKPEQMQKLSQVLGEPFETSKLSRIYPMAPELVSVEHWINSQPVSLKELRGKVVLIHFYAFQCHNCHANFGHYTKWHKQYKDQDVVVIGIQTPETSRERDPAAVKAAAAERGLKFPVLVDLESKNWAAWSNTMWPTVYVVDKNGYIRQWWQGELNWNGATGDETIEKLVAELLKEDVNS